MQSRKFWSRSDKTERSTIQLIPSRKKRSQLTGNHNRILNSSLAAVSRSRIELSVSTLSGFHTRHTKSKFINDVADWLKNILKDFGYTNIYFHHYKKNGYDLKNVICDKQGATNKVILICAHYDSIMEDINNSKDRAPGADDNASGVSAVLEIARIICHVSLEYSIQFAFFSGEEQDQWGAKNYSLHIKKNNVNLHRLINLDMVGRPQLSDHIIIERDLGNKVSTNDKDSQRFGEILEQMTLDYTDLDVLLGPIYDSDYMPFEALGYVVVGLYDGGQIYDTYHSKNDVPALLNMDFIVSVTKLVIATILNEITLS